MKEQSQQSYDLDCVVKKTENSNAIDIVCHYYPKTAQIQKISRNCLSFQVLKVL